MGVSDIIPGVSGGTIALIVGIYDRLIAALGNINVTWVRPAIRRVISGKRSAGRQAYRLFNRMDPLFLGVLVAGIGTALVAGSYLMPYLLTSYTSQTYAFFIGLIITSAIVIGLSHKRSFRVRHAVTAGIGLAVAWYMVGLQSLLSSHALPILFLSGFLALTAMLLPGISGSFVLVLLGQYAFVLSSLHAPFENILVLGVFILGGMTGVLLSSRLIKRLLQAYHVGTLSFLVGLMVGSLNLLVGYVLQGLESQGISTSLGYGSVVFFLLAGMGVVTGIHHLGRCSRKVSN